MPCDFGINRNILECKGGILSAISSPGICINRNILECKDKMRQTKEQNITVLIETYWNVK